MKRFRKTDRSHRDGERSGSDRHSLTKRKDAERKRIQS